MKQVIQIRCKNNKKTLEVPIGSTLYEVYRAFNLKMDFGPVSAKVNNKVEGMNYQVFQNKDVEFLDFIRHRACVLIPARCSWCCAKQCTTFIQRARW